MPEQKNNMTKLTENQFHTVWTAAVGRTGYNKQLFQAVLKQLVEQEMIISNEELIAHLTNPRYALHDTTMGTKVEISPELAVSMIRAHYPGAHVLVLEQLALGLAKCTSIPHGMIERIA